MNKLRAFWNVINGRAIVDTLFVLLSIVGVVLALFLKGDSNVYAYPFVCAVATLAALAVILLIVYAFTEGREYLRIISYILLACSIALTATVFVFTSEYEYPRELDRGSVRFRPLETKEPMRKNLDTVSALSPDVIFDFGEEYQKDEKKTAEPYKTYFTEYFKNYKLSGNIVRAYTNGKNNITVSADFKYFYKLPNVDSAVNSGIMEELFGENPTESGEKDGIKYFYAYKKDTTFKSGGTYWAYFQKENIILTVKYTVYSDERIYLDSTEITETLLSEITTYQIMN